MAATEVHAASADVTVVTGPGSGAHVTVSRNATGSIISAEIRMGCCRLRPAWEDVLQSFGPLGDRADGRSLFSQDLNRERPGCFDLAVIRTLYTLPAGSRREAVESEARRVLDDVCDPQGDARSAHSGLGTARTPSLADASGGHFGVRVPPGT